MQLAEMGLAQEIIKTLSLKDLEQINNFLRVYTERLYPFFSGFIQVRFAPRVSWQLALTSRYLACTPRNSSLFSYLQMEAGARALDEIPQWWERNDGRRSQTVSFDPP
jgi:hypothetical protein